MNYFRLSILFFSLFFMQNTLLSMKALQMRKEPNTNSMPSKRLLQAGWGTACLVFIGSAAAVSAEPLLPACGLCACATGICVCEGICPTNGQTKAAKSNVKRKPSKLPGDNNKSGRKYHRKQARGRTGGGKK